MTNPLGEVCRIGRGLHWRIWLPSSSAPGTKRWPVVSISLQAVGEEGKQGQMRHKLP